MREELERDKSWMKGFENAKDGDHGKVNNDKRRARKEIEEINRDGTWKEYGKCFYYYSKR